MKLTDSQLVILSGAAKRPGGSVLPLPKSVKLNKGAATLVLKSLLKHKFVAEELADRQSKAWRDGDDGQRFALSITPAGMKAIGVDASDTKPASPSEKTDSEKLKSSRDASVAAGKHKAAREGTKLSALITLLLRKTGATVEEAAKATGWQHHSIRGAMSGALKKKMGFKIDSSIAGDRGRVYRIEGGK